MDDAPPEPPVTFQGVLAAETNERDSDRRPVILGRIVPIAELRRWKR
ncbi:MAG: hypothetical protein QOE47_2759, partial [Pyrinomonadaceae bacterium]|nr:hypothetical protein [Pyrinomonadaceae bacterium]